MLLGDGPARALEPLLLNPMEQPAVVPNRLDLGRPLQPVVGDDAQPLLLHLPEDTSGLMND